MQIEQAVQATKHTLALWAAALSERHPQRVSGFYEDDEKPKSMPNMHPPRQPSDAENMRLAIELGKVLALRIGLEMSYHAIARELSISEPLVRKRVQQLRRYRE